MAVSYRSTGLYNSAGSTTAVVPAPTGTVDGDLIFVVIRRAAAVNPTGVPAGWTLVQSTLATYGFWVYYKVASSEGASWTWTWAARAKTLGRSHSFYGGYDIDNPIQNSTTPYSATASGTPVNIPTLTTAADNTLSVVLSSGYSTAAKTFSVPLNWTEHNDSGSTTPDFWQAIASQTIATSGTATGVVSYPVSAASTYRIGCQILINLPNNLPAVALNSPSDSSTTMYSTPTLNFTGTDLDGDVLDYRVQIDTSTGFNSQSGSPLLSVVSSADSGFISGNPYSSDIPVEYTVQSALSGGVYYWRVSANNPLRGGTYGAWSLTRSFTIIENNPPLIALNTPYDAATGLVVSPTFSFTGTDPESDSLEYEVQVDTVNTFDSVAGGAGESLFSNSFESADWTSVLVSGTNAVWTTATSTTHPSNGSPQEGSYLARFNSYTCTADAQARYYSSSTFNMPPNVGSANLSFWMYHDTNYTTNNDRVQLQISVNGGASWTDVGLAASRYNGNSGWEQVDIDLSSYAGVNNILIGFLGTSGYGNDCYIDNVVVNYSLPSTPLLDKTSTIDAGFTAGHPYLSGGTTDFTIQPGEELVESQVYYWRVRAIDVSGGNTYGAWSGVRSFSVGNISPSVTLNSPNDAQMTSTTPTFCFAGYDTEADTVEFNLQVDTVDTFDSQSGSPILSVFSNTDAGFSEGHPYTPESSVDYVTQTALSLGTYYWRVAAIDPLGRNIYGEWSVTQSIIVVDNAPPFVILNSPNNNATGTPVMPVLSFTGTDSENDNIEYEIQIDTVNTFDSNGGGSSTELFTNSFELSTGWTSVLVSGASAAWTRETSTTRPSGGTPQDGSYLARFNSYTCTAGAQARYYQSASFSVPINAISPVLSFWMYHDTAYPSNNDRVQLQVSLNGGSSWTNTGTAVSRYSSNVGWEKATVSLSKYVGSNNLMIGLLGIGAYGNDCYVDNITVSYDLPLIDKFSSIDAGFSADHPFNSGVTVEYAVQVGDTLTEGATYYWRTRGIDPLGIGVYGFWSETRCFTPNTGMKVWDGVSWAYKPVKIWNGSEWIARPVKVWDGSSWVING